MTVALYDACLQYMCPTHTTKVTSDGGMPCCASTYRKLRSWVRVAEECVTVCAHRGNSCVARSTPRACTHTREFAYLIIYCVHMCALLLADSSRHSNHPAPLQLPHAADGAQHAIVRCSGSPRSVASCDTPCWKCQCCCATMVWHKRLTETSMVTDHWSVLLRRHTTCRQPSSWCTLATPSTESSACNPPLPGIPDVLGTSQLAHDICLA
jgi:hypothetical protein